MHHAAGMQVETSRYSISTGQKNEMVANMHLDSLRNDSKILERDDDMVQMGEQSFLLNQLT